MSWINSTVTGICTQYQQLHMEKQSSQCSIWAWELQRPILWRSVMTVSSSHANAPLHIPTRNMLYTSPQGHIKHLVGFRKCSCPFASIPTKATEAFLIGMGGQNNSGETSWRSEVYLAYTSIVSSLPNRRQFKIIGKMGLTFWISTPAINWLTLTIN